MLKLHVGLNFTPAPSKLPLMDTMIAVESGTSLKLTLEDADDQRGCVCETLRRVKVPWSNLTRDQRTAVKELMGLEDEVILPADKRNATVRCDYDRKTEGMLRTDTYRKLRGDPTAAQENRLSRKFKGLAREEWGDNKCQGPHT